MRLVSSIVEISIPAIAAPRPFEASSTIFGLSKCVVAFTIAFANVDEFYNAFFEAFDGLFPEKRETGLRGVDIDSYLKDYPFFTRTDRVFRFLRDEVLITPEYNKIMDSMIEAAGFDIGKIAQKLWMTEAQLTDLHVNRNIIGLHSYSHPLAIARLQKAQQKDEYTKNFSHLSGLLGSVPKTMSHPSNSYSGETLEILNEMEVDVGFRADMVDIPKRSLLEIPREDHANILRMMQA